MNKIIYKRFRGKSDGLEDFRKILKTPLISINIKKYFVKICTSVYLSNKSTRIRLVEARQKNKLNFWKKKTKRKDLEKNKDFEKTNDWHKWVYWTVLHIYTGGNSEEIV